MQSSWQSNNFNIYSWRVIFAAEGWEQTQHRLMHFWKLEYTGENMSLWNYEIKKVTCITLNFT